MRNQRHGYKEKSFQIELSDMDDTSWADSNASSEDSGPLLGNKRANDSDASGSGSSLVYSNGTSWYYISLGIYI